MRMVGLIPFAFLAQLVERHLEAVGVTGSNPVESITTKVVLTRFNMSFPDKVISVEQFEKEIDEHELIRVLTAFGLVEKNLSN